MPNASDLATYEEETRGAPPWVFVVFLVLMVLGAGACYFFYVNLLAARRETASVYGFVKKDIIEPLRANGVKVSTAGRPGPGFFSDAEGLLRKGVEHEKLSPFVGWDTRAQVEKVLAERKDVVGAASLRVLAAELEKLLNNKRQTIVKLHQDIKAAEQKVRQARVQMERTRSALLRQIAEKMKELERLKQKHTRRVFQLRASADNMEKARRQVASQIDGLRLQLKKAKEERLAEAKKFEEQIAKLQEQIKKLEELEPRPDGPDGHIAQVNNRLGYAMIDIGDKDTVEVGEHFEVYEKTKDGGRRLKGEVVVQSVDKNISRVGIVKTKDPLNPILKGDLLRRKKLRRKYEIEVRAKRRREAAE